MSGKKTDREYLAVMRELGLTVTSVTKTTSGRLRIQVVAANGATRPFFVSEHGGDWRAVKNNIAEFKRFADENPTPVVGRALAKALDNVTDNTPIQVAAPIPSPAPISAPVAPPAAPAAPIESKPVNLKPNPELPLVPKSTITIQRLDRKEFHTLTKWVVANVPQGREITLESLAREASKALDLHIAASSVKDALDLEEIKLAEPARRGGSMRDRAHVIARELVRVMQSLGVEPNDDLVAIAERKGQ